MSLATIIKKIGDDAEAYGQKLIDQANAEADRILAAGREEAEREAQQIIRQAEEDVQRFKNKQMATALLQVRKDKLDNRQQLLDEVFSKALDRILNCEAEQYTRIVKNILLSVDEERSGTIRLAQADRSLITEEFVEEMNQDLKKQNRQLQFQLSSETIEIKRGCILDFQDFEMNFSLETLLTEMWEGIRSEISRRLFEDGNH
jgi:V/A-type H+-transporting ATPase subunit E